VIADVGRRNTLFGAEAQQAGAHLERWTQLARRLKSIAPGGTTQRILQIKPNYLGLPILQ
jgi:hypothetical protein